jgi:type IV pilus assembly protein PilC
MSRISTRNLIQLLQRLGTSLRAGIDIRRIWHQEAEHGSMHHRTQAARVAERLGEGDTLAEAMSACGGYFPMLTVDLVDVGERSGRLDVILAGLAEHYSHLLSLRRTFLVGIAWPALQLTAAIVIVGVLIWLMGVLSPDIAILGLRGPDGLMTYMLIIVMVAATGTILTMGVSQGRFGLAPIHLALRIPVLGNCLKTMALARLAWSLGLALDAGVDARMAMRLALRSTQNPLFASQADAVDRQLLDGSEFNEALQQTGVFPDEFLQALATAELSGTYGESLERLADEYRQRAQAASRTLTIIASFVVWGLVAAMLLIVIFQIFTSVILQPYREAMDFMEESL